MMEGHQACKYCQTVESVPFQSLVLCAHRLQDILFNLTQSLQLEESLTILKQTFAISIDSRQPNQLGNISSQSLDPTIPMSSASFPPDLLSADIGDQSFMTSFSAFVDDALFLPRDPGLKFVSTSVVDFTISGVEEISNLQNPVNLSFSRSDVSL